MSCALGGLAGLVRRPARAVHARGLGLALRERGERLQRAYALDSAGEEAALIVAPLLVAVAVALASPRAALAVAAAVMLAGTIAAARSRLARGPRPPRRAARPRAAAAGALWLLFGALAPTAAALGAIDIAVPAAAREQGHLGGGGRAAGGDGGRRRWPAACWRGARSGAGRREWRVIALQVRRWRAGSRWRRRPRSSSGLLGAALLIPGAALGALFATLYLLADRLAPAGSGTRTFAWLVTANNGGLGARRGGRRER